MKIIYPYISKNENVLLAPVCIKKSYQLFYENSIFYKVKRDISRLTHAKYVIV